MMTNWEKKYLYTAQNLNGRGKMHHDNIPMQYNASFRGTKKGHFSVNDLWNFPYFWRQT